MAEYNSPKGIFDDIEAENEPEFDFDAAYKVYFQNKTKGLGRKLLISFIILISLIYFITKMPFSYMIGAAIIVSGGLIGLKAIIGDYYFYCWNRLGDEEKIELYIKISNPNFKPKSRLKLFIGKPAICCYIILICIIILSKILMLEVFDLVGYVIGMAVVIAILLSIYKNGII